MPVGHTASLAGPSGHEAIGRLTALSSDASVTRTLEVADSGIGIPAEELEHMVDRSCRSSPATAAVIGGTGLGLTNIRGIVRAHGGEIEVSSDAGVGTTVPAELPGDVVA